jgi:murein DD-endopeptidase MepM/ murein hydrolase activator NlpD
MTVTKLKSLLPSPSVRRGAFALGAVLFLSGLVLPASARAQTDELDQEAAERAANAIEQTRREAEAAVQAFADAETELEEATAELEQVLGRQRDVDAAVGALREQVRNLALYRYVNGTGGTSPLLALTSDVESQLPTETYVRLATDQNVSSADDYEAALEDLERAEAEVRARQADLEQAKRDLTAYKQALDEKIVQLQAAEEERLRNVAVRKELERREAQERRRREAAAAAAAQEAARQAAEAARRGGSSAATIAAPGGGGDPGGADPGDGGGGGSGGGGGGGGYPGSGMICPVAGPNSFVDTWGASRSGGRRHQGVDLISPHGTPVAAVVGGAVQQKRVSLGGNVIWLFGNDGNSYFYAHLSGYGQGGTVNAGDIIGYVGDTGNARGTPHLHFEIHPGGGGAINPYPATRAVC